jgi:heat shock protein HslJ
MVMPVRDYRVVRRLAISVASVALLWPLSACGPADGPIVVGDSAAPASTPAASASPTATGPEPELVGTDWVLVEFTRDGHTTTVPADIDSDLLFDSGGHFSAKACNWGGGQAVLDGQQLHVQGGIETEMSCSGIDAAIEDAVFGDRRVPPLGVMGSGDVAWSIEQQRLVLQATNGDTLVYQVRDPIYPTQPSTTIVAGEHGGIQYRVALSKFDDGRDRVVLELRRPESLWGVGGMAVPTGHAPMDSFLLEPLGDEDLVAGVVPSSAVRVVYRDPALAGGVKLRIYDVEGAEWKIFAGFVPHTGRKITAPDTITAYDADGQIVAICPSSPAPVPRCSV